MCSIAIAHLFVPSAANCFETTPSPYSSSYCSSPGARKQPEVAEATSVSYKKTVSKFTAFLLERAVADITEITSDDVLRFRNHEAKTH